MHKNFLGDGVQLGRGLIEQQHARAQRQHGSQRQQLLASARKRVGIAVEPILQPKEIAGLGHATAHLVARHAQVFQAKRHLVPHGLAHNLVFGVLKHIAHALRGRPNVHVGNVLAQHEQFASALARRSDLGLEQRQQRRLTRPGTTNEQRKRALGNSPVKPLEHRRLGPGVGKAQASHFNRRLIRAARRVRHHAPVQPSHQPNLFSSTACSTQGSAIQAAYTT